MLYSGVRESNKPIELSIHCALCQCLCCLGHHFILAIFLFVPSLDEIQQPRSDVAWLEQKNSLDIKNCDGKACVRIMKNNCHGIDKDYCVIDTK